MNDLKQKRESNDAKFVLLIIVLVLGSLLLYSFINHQIRSLSDDTVYTTEEDDFNEIYARHTKELDGIKPYYDELINLTKKVASDDVEITVNPTIAWFTDDVLESITLSAHFKRQDIYLDVCYTYDPFFGDKNYTKIVRGTIQPDSIDQFEFYCQLTEGNKSEIKNAIDDYLDRYDDYLLAKEKEYSMGDVRIEIELFHDGLFCSYYKDYPVES